MGNNDLYVSLNQSHDGGHESVSTFVVLLLIEISYISYYFPLVFKAGGVTGSSHMCLSQGHRGGSGVRDGRFISTVSLLPPALNNQVLRLGTLGTKERAGSHIFKVHSCSAVPRVAEPLVMLRVVGHILNT